jgi:hypothetical protein
MTDFLVGVVNMIRLSQVSNDVMSTFQLPIVIQSARQFIEPSLPQVERPGGPVVREPAMAAAARDLGDAGYMPDIMSLGRSCRWDRQMSECSHIVTKLIRHLAEKLRLPVRYDGFENIMDALEVYRRYFKETVSIDLIFDCARNSNKQRWQFWAPCKGSEPIHIRAVQGLCRVRMCSRTTSRVGRPRASGCDLSRY